MPFIANIAAKFASKYLGEYFDGVEKKNIEASLIGGETIFKGLTLKPSALDQFNLPVEIKEGTLAKLVLKIPWTSLGSEPTIVRIEEFFITLGPKPRSSQTAAKSDEMALNRKKQRLKLAALLRQDQPAEDKERIKKEKKAEKKERRKDEGKMSLAQTLQKKVLANLQLYIDKIHIRYEDNTTNSEQAFCFGITIEKFHAQTANGDWEPSIVKVKEQIVHKLVELRNLSLYFDTPKERGAVMLRSKNSTTAKLMNLHLFQDGSPPPDHNYIISPLSGTMRLRMDQRRENVIDYSIPKLSCEVHLESAGFSVNKVQYSAAMEFLQYCQAYQKSAKYLRYRPDFENAPNKARAYWKYALDCVLADVRRNYQGWTWESILSRKKDRLLYVQLYTKRQLEGKKKLLSDERAEMERIEAKYSLTDLILYRKLANTAIMNSKKPKKEEEKKDKDKKDKKDKEKKDKDKEKKKDDKKDEKAKDKADKKEEKEKEKAEKEREKAEKKASKKSSTIIAAINSQTGSNFDNEDVMNELYYSLGMQQETESSQNGTGTTSSSGPPPGYVKTELKFRLGTATFGLSEMPDVDSRLASVVTKDMAVHVEIRGGGSLTVSGSVGKFNVFDYHTLGGRELATLRPDPRQEDASHPLALFIFDRNPLDAVAPEEPMSPEPAFRSSGPTGALTVPQASSSKGTSRSPSPTPRSPSPSPSATPVKVDYRIKFVAYPIYVTVSRPFIDRILAFFKVSKGKSKKVGANVANKAASRIKKAGQKNLQKALKKRKVTQIDIDFLAPRIIVPESFVGEDCAAMIIDFGHLVAKTTGPPPIPASLTGAARAQAKKEAANYDHYDISLKGITSYFVWSQAELDQLITGGVARGKKASKFTSEEIAGGVSPNTLVRRLDVQVYAKLLSRAPTGKLPRLKIDGSMSGLELDLSTERVGALMGAIRAATQKTTAKQHADLIKAKHAYLDARGGRNSSGKRLKIDQAEIIKALEITDTSSESKKKSKSEGPESYKRPKSYKLAVAVAFEIPSVSVVVHHQFGRNPTPVPLLTASLQSGKFRLVKSTQDMRIAVRLLGLYVDDQFLVRSGLARADRGPYFIVNTINERGHALVQLDFTQITKKSPMWTGITNNLKVEFNTLEVNLNRPTLAALVATLAEYIRAMKATKAVTSSAASTEEATPSQVSPKRSPSSVVPAEGNSGDQVMDLDTGTWSAATASIGSAIGVSTRSQPSRSQKRPDEDNATSNTFNSTFSTSATSTTSTSATVDLSDTTDFSDYSLTSASSSAVPKIDLKAQLALLAKEHEKQQEAQGTQKKKATSKAPDKRSKLRVEVSVHMVRINFNRHTKTWFVTRFGDIGIQINKHMDGTMVISGFLGAISARDKNEIRWHDIIRISSDEAASFRFEQYRPNLSDYPGYKHSLNVNVASIRIVVLQRLLKEFTKYFGGVSKMKKFASAATGIRKPGEKEPTGLELQRKLEEVEANRIAAERKKKKKKSTSDEKTAMRLHIELGNPLLIIPKTGDDPEHLQLDLGRITVTNTFGIQGNDVKVDEINIVASGLNIRAFIKDDTTTAKRLIGRTLMSDVMMNAQVIRPLTNNQDFSVPDMQLIANMSKFDIFISENELALIFGTLSGNISEFPLRVDDEMAIVLKYLEGAHLDQWLDQEGSSESAADAGNAAGGVSEKKTESKSLQRKQKKLDLSKSNLDSPSTERLPTSGSENGSLAIQTISAATSSSMSSARGPLAKDARKVLDSVTRVKLLLKLNFDQVSGTIFRGSGTDFVGAPTSLVRAHLSSFRLSFAQQADKGKVIKLALLNIILEDASTDTRNQFRRLLASNPKDKDDVSASSSSTTAPPSSARRSLAIPAANGYGDGSEEDYVDDDDDDDDGSRTERRKKRENAANRRKAAGDDSTEPSDTENSVFLVYEARPKAERYEVVSIKINRPRIYVVPSACAALILFVRPLIKIALRTISIFGKRKRLGSLGDQRRLATFEVERAHEQMQRQLDLLQTSQEAELEALLGNPGSGKVKKRDKVALKKSENSAAMSKLKAELEAGFATLVAEVGKKKRSGIKKERTIKVALRSPEICVLEDPERSRNVFILHLSDATIKTHMIGKNQTIALHLFELDARKGQVDPITNETSERILLIQPFDVVTKLERVNEAETKLNNIKIKIGVIHTIVSYRDMKLAMAVIRGFGTVGKGFSASKKAVAKTVAATSIAPLKRFGVAEATIEKAKGPKVKPQLVLVFKIRVMNFTLLNDTNRLFVTPLLKIDIEGVENFLTRGYDMRLNLELRSIKCQAYNIDLAAYEPIVEPWGLDVLLKKEGKATTVNIKAETLLSINLTRSLLDTVFNTMRFFSALSKKKKRENGDEGSGAATPMPGSLVLSAGSNGDEPHSVPLSTSGNSTAGASNLKMSNSTSLTSLASMGPSPGPGTASSNASANASLLATNTSASMQTAERSFAPFIISNGTCKPIKFWFSHMNEDTAQYLDPEAECPVIIEKSSKQLLSGVMDDESSKFDIDVEILFYEDANSHQFVTASSSAAERKWKSVVLHKIPIDKVHSAKTYALPAEFSNVQFVSENVRRGGTKILTLRTTQNIINNTAHDIELLITKPHSTTGLISHSHSSNAVATTSTKKGDKAPQSHGRAPKMDTHSFVIGSGKSKSIPLEFLSYTSIKLRTAGYDWCEWSNRASVVGICRRLPEASRRTTTNDYWSCVIVYDRIEDDFATYVSITLHPALQFENLLASMVLIKMLQPGESPDDVQNVADVDAGRDVAIYQSHGPNGHSKGEGPPTLSGQMAAEKKRLELPSTNGDASLQLTHQRFSICVGGFYWSEPVDLLQLYIAAANFKPGPQEKAAYEKPMEVRDVNNRTLSFIAEVTEPMKGCLKIALYAQYWIINQTGLKLNYRVNGRSPTLVDDNARSTEIKGDPRSWYREAERDGFASGTASPVISMASSGSSAVGASSSALGQSSADTKKTVYVGPGKWRLAAPTKFYFSGDELQAQVAGYGTTEVQQGKIATVLNTAMDKLGAGNGASQWSNSLPLADRDSKKHNVDIDRMAMPDVKTPRTFEFHCSVKHAPGKFWRTQEIRIAPQYILVNKTRRHLVYRQVDQVEATTGTSSVKNDHLSTCDLMAGDQLPFHWSDSSLLIKQLSINYSAEQPGLNELRDSEGLLLDPTQPRPETHWSGRFSIDAIDNFMIKIRDRANPERFDLINVSIKERHGVKYVILRPGSEDFIQLIRIENQSEWEIVVEQKLRINTSITTASTETQSPSQIASSLNSGASTPAVLTPQASSNALTALPSQSSNVDSQPKSYVHFTESIPVRTIQPYYWDEPHKRTKVLLLHVKPPPGVPLSRNYSYSVSSLAEDASAGADEYVYGWKANARQRFKVQVQVRGFTKVVVVTNAGAASEDIPEDGQIAESSPQQKQEEDKSTISLEMDFAGIGLSVIDSFPQEIFYVSMKSATLRYRRVGKVHSFGFVAKTGQVDNQLYLAPDPLMVYGLKSDPAPFLSLSIDIDTTEKKIIYFTKLHMVIQRLELNVDQIAILAAAAFSSIASKAIKQQKMIQNIAFALEDVIPILADKYMRSDKYYFQNINLESIKSFFSLRRATNKKLLPIVNQRLKRALTTVLKISSIERQKLIFSGFVVPSAFSSMKDMQRRIVKHYKSVVMSNISSLLLNYVTKVVRTMWSGSIQPPVIQMRPPRFFPPDDLVVIYDRPLAYGQKLLRCICEGAFYKEHYYFHYFISGQELILSSHKWLMMCRSSEYDALSFAIIWKEKLDDIISFVAPASETNIKVIFDPHTGEDPHFREIYCRTSEQSSFIASKIESAVSRNKFASLTSIRRAGEDADA
jgi:hypothetical protein